MADASIRAAAASSIRVGVLVRLRIVRLSVVSEVYVELRFLFWDRRSNFGRPSPPVSNCSFHRSCRMVLQPRHVGIAWRRRFVEAVKNQRLMPHWRHGARILPFLDFGMATRERKAAGVFVVDTGHVCQLVGGRI